ncbi:hypothetical protein [Absidia glauca]|uniref:BZIP domain-containing protein n=1 Tax=Absidia glauca TaxID=4829 RepID=A0A163MC05_ABSGL|nr:hypothetical protein [Absidia glauca]
MSYISSLNLLSDDAPIPLSEEDVTDELALWANAQFKFDSAPGSALLDDPLKQSVSTSASTTNGIYGILNSYNHFDPPHPSSMMTMLQTANVVSPTSNDMYSPSTTPSTPTFNMAPTFEEEVGDKKETKTNDEEKRKRNTAASARFRMKKKQREQALQQTVQEMTTKTEQLEKRCKELELEAKWLRALLIEKNPALVTPLSSVASS